LAGRRAPTFLKRQKEQKRNEKANAKRAARQQRRENRASGVNTEPGYEELGPIDPDGQMPGETPDEEPAPQTDATT